MNDLVSDTVLADHATTGLGNRADEAAAMLKAMSNPSRLRLLCALAGPARSVGELEDLLSASQSYVSGQLARLRAEGLVTCERQGRQMQYSLADPRAARIIERLYEVFPGA